MKDIDILNIDNTSNKAGLSISGNTVTGIRLLAQRVLLILLTDISGTLRTGEGTDLSDILMTQQSSTDHVSLLLISAISTAKSILYSEVPEEASEALQDIIIQDVNTENGTIEFSIVVTNRLGHSDTIAYTTGSSL